MKIAHISDLHIDSLSPVIYGVNPCENLQKALSLLRGIHNLDAVILSGDISNDGNEESYLLADSMLSALRVPVFCVLGNHDNSGVVAYLVKNRRFEALLFEEESEIEDYKFLFLNSVREAPDGGNMSRGFISREDMNRVVRETGDFPGKSVLVMHHPSFEVGGWMDARILVNRTEFNSMVAEQPNIIAVLSGHNHCPAEVTVNGCLFSIAPSVSTTFDSHKERFREIYRPAISVLDFHGKSIAKEIISIWF